MKIIYGIDRLVKASLFASLFLGSVGLSAQEVTPPEAVVLTSDNRIELPLTTATPDPFRGLEAFVNVKLGNCVACHTNFDVAAMQFLGEIGPDLNWIGDRLSVEELRAIVVDPKAAISPDTIMPAFYTPRPGFRTLENFEGKTILTANQVEDIVAYLSSLSKDTTFDGVD